MSTTVTYKGNTLTTVDNQTRTLLTSGKYLEDNITLVDVTQGGTANLVPYVIRPDATKIKTYTYDKKIVANSVLSSLPTYSTSTQEIVAAGNLEEVSTDLSTYDYYVTHRYLTAPIYNTDTIAKGRNEFWFATYAYELASIPPNSFVAKNGTQYATRLTAIPQTGALYRLFYWSSTSAVTLYNTATYGWCMSVNAPSATSNAITIKSPQLNVRGHTTYLNSTVWGQTTDVRYQYIIELWRAPKANLNVDGWGIYQQAMHALDCAKSSSGTLT